MVQKITILGWLRYILFHHQTTTPCYCYSSLKCCVISSFITKPQRKVRELYKYSVALYPLSSPNHNFFGMIGERLKVALYPLSSPNHNCFVRVVPNLLLRYILFHHQTTTLISVALQAKMLRYILFHPQTTTLVVQRIRRLGCVISSFITKPQLPQSASVGSACCVISSFITKPQP